MSVKPLVPLVLAVALAGCKVVAQVKAPGATAASVQASAGTSSGQEASLPFKTVAFDPEGQGRFFKGGASETAVLRSKADLDAFLGRRQLAVQPQPAVPVPSASFGPPSSIPFGTQPSFQPDPLPETLTQLDFTKYTAIALFEGSAKVATTERIVAVREQGGNLVVSIWRWDPPANPAAIADVNGRLHVIALPRTDKQISFLPPEAKDGVSAQGEGGYGVGGNPTMKPKWPAVPNPDFTRDMIEQAARGGLQGKVDGFELEQVPISSLPAEEARGMSFTPDSLIWSARATGTLGAYGPGGALMGPGPSVGGAPPTFTEVDELISPEDGRVLRAISKNPTFHPGFGFDLAPTGDLHLGDTLHFTTTGQPVDGTLTLTLRSSSAAPLVKEIAYKDLPSFSLVIDAAHLPFLTGADIQPLTIELKFANGTSSRDVKVLKDASAKQSPPQRIQGSGTLADYHPQPGETAADAFVRAIAAEDWQGTGLTFTNHASTIAEVKPKGNQAIDLDPKTAVRVYEVHGTFPTFVVPGVNSSTNKDEVMAPDHLEITVTDALPIRVVSLQAFPR